MPLYNCKICNFSTKLKGNFKQHNNTKKHRAKLLSETTKPKEPDHIIQNNPALIQNNPKIIQNNPKIFMDDPAIIQNNPVPIYKCDFCPKKFTIHSNKRRHEMYRCKENPEFLDKLIKSWQSGKPLFNKIKNIDMFSRENLSKELDSILRSI